MRYLTRKKD